MLSSRRVQLALGLASMASTLGVLIGGSAVLGHWLDGKFGTDPILTVVLLFLGLAVGLYDAFGRLRQLVAMNDKNDN